MLNEWAIWSYYLLWYHWQRGKASNKYIPWLVFTSRLGIWISFPCLFYRILQTLCRKVRLPKTFHFRHLAHLTPGFVGADLMALCREAAMCAVNRVLMKLQEQQQKNPEIEGLPSEGGQEERIGTEPTSKTQVLSL